jgi:hypothetical protein
MLFATPNRPVSTHTPVISLSLNETFHFTHCFRYLHRYLDPWLRPFAAPSSTSTGKQSRARDLPDYCRAVPHQYSYPSPCASKLRQIPLLRVNLYHECVNETKISGFEQPCLHPRSLFRSIFGPIFRIPEQLQPAIFLPDCPWGLAHG